MSSVSSKMSPSSSPVPSSPTSYMTVPTRPTTPPSSPPDNVEENGQANANDKAKDEAEDDQANEDTEARMKMLDELLKKSAAYVSILKEQMDKVQVHYGKRRAAKPEHGHEATPSSKKRRRSGAEENDEQSTKRKKTEQAGQAVVERSQESNDANAFVQPALVTGATLRDYQLEGVAWMVGLYQSGISGILADEMGLGKTLQAIAFHAFLRERSVAPFLVVCPLSVLQNWVDEFHRFTPDIPVCMYHGTPEERAELRRTQMVFSESDMEYQDKAFRRYVAKESKAKPGVAKGKGKVGTKSTTEVKTRKKSSRVTAKSRAHTESDDQKPKTRGKKRGGAKKAPTRTRKVFESEDERVEEDEEPMEVDDKAGTSTVTSQPLPPHQKTNFPVVITTYEMIMKDRAQLERYAWGFIVVDEGHRLKNLHCKLMREIKKLNAAARMVLTGTPLHNNLAELWALLNFVLPDLFTDLDAFEEWFDLPMLQSKLSPTRSAQLIHSLHAVLRPFLLRRLKSDVETDLPPKKEYVLYAPLSEHQREIYDAIVDGTLRALLVKEAGGKSTSFKPEEEDEEEVPLKVQAARKEAKSKYSARLRQNRQRNYSVDGSDDDYFEKLESGPQKPKATGKSAEDLGREWQRKSMMKKINGMKLQNTVMQLRKVCSHPFLFDWPVDPNTRAPVLNEDLVSTSGKMMVLDRLLEELFRRDHKVLLFSQFTTVLDIIEDWAVGLKGWPICRIDGSTSMTDRCEEVDRFEKSGDTSHAPRLFLLSTRAGGLGLNLVAADTVIFYDQDWNPQMDLQAQDRAHRIGQTRPVLIFRLVSAHTIEAKIMERATEKRKLEALVIAKGQFKTPTLAVGRSKPETMTEMAASLLRLEGEKIQVVPNTEAGKASVISDEELDMLLDRRPEVFVDRGKGWTSAGQEAPEEAAVKTAKFAVYEAPVHEAGDMLAGMMDDDDE
ncbi:SNF2 family N-terminal domain-containing protein [Sparassis latifolia]